MRKENEKSGRRSGMKAMTDEELTREASLENLRAINRALRRPDATEKRVLGSLQKIECNGSIVFTVKTETETFMLTSKDFASLALNAFVPMAGDSSIGCDTDLSSVKAMIAFREFAVPNRGLRGSITSIEFVPSDFRLLSDEEMNRSIAFDPNSQVTDNKTKEAIAREINRQLVKPDADEKREMGYLEQIECTTNGRYFYMRTGAKSLRLFASSPAAVKIRLFTRELEGMQFGCVMKPIDVPAVFIYKEIPNARSQSDGEIISIDFVPRSFRLDQTPGTM